MIKQYVVDAFAERLFQGNQAAICVAAAFPPDDLMKQIAVENRFSETAFVIRQGGRYALRWFTPGGEIDLCGHATLASAYVLFRFYEKDSEQIVFSTRGGELTVARRGESLEMAFPAFALREIPVTDEMEAATGARPVRALMGRDMLLVYPDEDIVRGMKPDLAKVVALDGVLLHVTAPGRETDSVSRSFAPKHHIDEDPVCGSGHCHIAPYWADVLGKGEIIAFQASARGGTLRCRVAGDTVYISGTARLFSAGEILPDDDSY